MAASLKEQIDDLIGKLNPGGIFGIDIGSHSIKVCEVSGSPGKMKVDKFGVFVLSEAAIIEDQVQKPEELIEGVLEAMKRAGIKSKVACMGLYGPNTMTKRLNVPEGTNEEIEDHIMWEAEQYITFGADESQVGFHIIGDNEGGGKDALVAAARNELIENFSKILNEAKITPKIVDLNILALSNAFEEAYADELDEYSKGTLLIDFGAQTTKILVYKRNGPIFTKELPIGGGLITEEIQRQMGVSYEEAEDLKTTTDDNGNLPDEILAIMNNQVDQTLAEVKKNINFYISQGSAEKVSYCFVTGGASLAPELVEKLAGLTGLEVKNLSLFPAIKIDQKKAESGLDQLSAISTVAVGLAMRKIN